MQREKEKEEYGGRGGRGGGGKIGGEERCEELKNYQSAVRRHGRWTKRERFHRERQRSTWLIHDKCLSERRITLGPSDNDHQDDDKSGDGDDSDGNGDSLIEYDDGDSDSDGDRDCNGSG